MRIAYIAIKGMPIGGGIEKLTEEIGSRLVDRGHHVLVYSSRDFGASDGYFKGMEVVTVPSLNTKSFHKFSICFCATLHMLTKTEVDLVHFHAVGPSMFALIPRLSGIPTVVQTHGFEWKRDKWGFIGKSFFRLADYTAVYFPHKTTSVSKTQKEYYERKFAKEVIYIPTGGNKVVMKQPSWIFEQGLAPGRYILFAARLVEEKGAHYLIEAFRSINTDMKLVIAGDAAYSEKYKQSLKSMSSGDSRIVFTGFITGAPLQELFSNAYLFCLPSTLEGLPIALLEAMSYGNCCLASDIPENLEALEDHGYTFKNRDPLDLARVLSSLVKDPKRVERMKERARTHVFQNYSWDGITDQMEDLYFSLVNESRQ